MALNIFNIHLLALKYNKRDPVIRISFIVTFLSVTSGYAILCPTQPRITQGTIPSAKYAHISGSLNQMKFV
jgi:hypothetical protein